MPASLVVLLGSVVTALDPIPKDDDVKAGWIGFGLFIILLVVVGLLGWSLTRHLRQVERNRLSGTYGDVPEPDGAAAHESVEPGAAGTAGPSDGSPRSR